MGVREGGTLGEGYVGGMGVREGGASWVGGYVWGRYVVVVVVVAVNFQQNTDGMISPKFSKFCPVISAHFAVTEEDPFALVLF